MALAGPRHTWAYFRMKMLPTIEEVLGPPDPDCDRCEGEGWVCEEHLGMPFPHDDCAGPGDPCPTCRPHMYHGDIALAGRSPSTYLRVGHSYTKTGR